MTHINMDELDTSGDIRTIAEEAGALDPTGSTRRGLIKRGAVGAGAVAGSAAFFGFLSPMEAFAQSSGVKGEYSRPKVLRRGKAPSANDAKIGNYALTLEYLEAAFYAGAVQANYADPQINAAAKVLATHEAAHVEALQGILGRNAVSAPDLNATTVAALLKDQATFIAVAAAIEPVGTAAYAGAGPYVQNLGIVKAALAIHSVEANHAAFVAQLAIQKGITKDVNGTTINPVPNILNPAFSFKRTIGIVGDLNLVTGTLQPNS